MASGGPRLARTARPVVARDACLAPADPRSALDVDRVAALVADLVAP